MTYDIITEHLNRMIGPSSFILSTINGPYLKYIFSKISRGLLRQGIKPVNSFSGFLMKCNYKRISYGLTLVSFISPLSFLIKISLSLTNSPVLFIVVSLKEILNEIFLPSIFPFSNGASPN